MTDNHPWRHTIDTQDEDGNDERWEFYYRRLTRRTVVAATSIDVETATRVTMIDDLGPQMIRRIELNSNVVEDWDDGIPFDILEDGFDSHPFFRDRPSDADSDDGTPESAV